MRDNQRPITDSTRRASEGLLEALRRWREVHGPPGPGTSAPGLRLLDANREVVELAKGSLMLRYGIDSYQAFAVMVRWSRVTHTSVHVIAHTLLRGVCTGSPEVERRQRSLVRWLEEQLRNGDPDLERPAKPPVWLQASA